MSKGQTTLKEFLRRNREYLSPDKFFYLYDLLNREFFQKPLELPKVRVLLAREVSKLEFDVNVPLQLQQQDGSSVHPESAKSNVGQLNALMHKVDLMTGYDFEAFLTRVFRGIGHDVEQTPLSGDQGADLILDKQTVVQAKRTSGTVGNKAVQEVHAAKQYYACPKALVVTNGLFSESAKGLAKKCDVELWDRPRLIQPISKYLAIRANKKKDV